MGEDGRTSNASLRGCLRPNATKRTTVVVRTPAPPLTRSHPSWQASPVPTPGVLMKPVGLLLRWCRRLFGYTLVARDQGSPEDSADPLQSRESDDRDDATPKGIRNGEANQTTASAPTVLWFWMRVSLGSFVLVAPSGHVTPCGGKAHLPAAVRSVPHRNGTTPAISPCTP